MSWNGRDQEIMLELNKHKIDICGVSETKKKGKGTTQYPDYILIYSGKEKRQRAHSGVGLVLSNRYEQFIDDIKYVSDRLLKITLKFHKNNLNIITTYAPDMTKPKEQREEFYNCLQQVLDDIPSEEQIIILGDLNARIGNQPISGIKQKYNETTVNDNGLELISQRTPHQ
jgi:hypothetical protein